MSGSERGRKGVKSAECGPLYPVCRGGPEEDLAKLHPLLITLGALRTNQQATWEVEAGGWHIELGQLSESLPTEECG